MFRNCNIANTHLELEEGDNAASSRVCRACLARGADEHLFHSGGELARQYCDCSTLEAQSGDGFPEYICKGCSNKMNDFLEFRRNCLHTYNELLREFQSKNSTKADDEERHDCSYGDRHLNIEEDPEKEIAEDTQSTNCVYDSSHENGSVSINETKKSSNGNHLYAKKLFKCDYCKKSFKSRGWLKNHLQSHTQSAVKLDHNTQDATAIEEARLKLICPTCKRRFYKYSKFENHLRTHMGLPATKLSCDLCGKLLKSEKSLRTHMQLHDENKKEYYCDICHKHFRQRTSFKVHQQIHNGIKRSICHVCGLSFQEQNMKVHLRHAKERKYSCKSCNKSFVLSVELKIHELRHQKFKKFSCTHCSKNFYTKRELDRHLGSHSDRKPYECSMCDKSFKSSSYLTVHKRTHTGERPFSCEFCEQTFKRGKDLRNHRMRHTGERPYRCHHCDKTFIQKTPLNRHLRAHARNNDSKHYDKKQDDTVNSGEHWYNKAL